MCINFYINSEYIIALKWKTWNIKWDRSLRRLLWILCKSTKCSWRIAQCDSSKRNQRETRIGGFFRIGCSSKINIILVSQNHIVCIYFICQIVTHRNFSKLTLGAIGAVMGTLAAVGVAIQSVNQNSICTTVCVCTIIIVSRHLNQPAFFIKCIKITEYFVYFRSRRLEILP